MKVLTQGKLLADEVFQSQCRNCSTSVEFSRKEAHSQFDRNEELLSVKCPTCGYAIFAYPKTKQRVEGR